MVFPFRVSTILSEPFYEQFYANRTYIILTLRQLNFSLIPDFVIFQLFFFSFSFFFCLLMLLCKITFSTRSLLSVKTLRKKARSGYLVTVKSFGRFLFTINSFLIFGIFNNLGHVAFCKFVGFCGSKVGLCIDTRFAAVGHFLQL